MKTTPFKVIQAFSFSGQDVAPAAEGQPDTLVELTERQAVQCINMGLVQAVEAVQASAAPSETLAIATVIPQTPTRPAACADPYGT